MTFEYQLPQDLESMAWGHPPELQILVQESTLIQTHPLDHAEYGGAEPSRNIWHYSLSDRGYTWLSLIEEPNIIEVLQYWNARMEFRKEHGF